MSAADVARIGFVKALIEVRLQVDLGCGRALHRFDSRADSIKGRLLNGIKST